MHLQVDGFVFTKISSQYYITLHKDYGSGIHHNYSYMQCQKLINYKCT